MIDIDCLWCTQHSLKRMDTIPDLMKLEFFDTPIELHRCPDGELQINDGHHRLVSIWLSGRDELLDYGWEFVIRDMDEIRTRTKLKIKDLAKQYKELHAHNIAD